MARKDSSGSAATRGFDDIIGVVLLVAAALLLIAQWSFDSGDLSPIKVPPNSPPHNWIGSLGAYFAWGGFLVFGMVGYFLPALFAIFGAAFLLRFLPYLREHLRWSVSWTVGLLVSLTGLLYLADHGGLRGTFHEKLGTQSIGGWLGLRRTARRRTINTAFPCSAPSVQPSLTPRSA